jgi:hypothetical protein
MDRSISRRTNPSRSGFCRLVVAAGLGVASTLSIAPAQATLCGGANYPFPFTDVSAVGAPFCPGIMEAYVTGVSKGTTPTTFSPNETVPRLQMTTFLQRSLDQGLARTSRRAALDQWWTPQNPNSMQLTSAGDSTYFCSADGEYIWSAGYSGFVNQVQASTGKVLNSWTGATNALGIRAAAGLVFIAGETSPGSMYVIDPTLPAGPVTYTVSGLGDDPVGIAFDGSNIWTANFHGGVSIITPLSPGYSVATVIAGFTNPYGILYDGAHIWVTDNGAGTLLKLDSGGAILQTVTAGSNPQIPVFDGTNIWVPNFGSNSITVVQASSGNVVASIGADANNKLNQPAGASFDGERILVTNYGGNTVTVFKAADLSFIANVSTATGFVTGPWGACSDGVNFWVAFLYGVLLRF